MKKVILIFLLLTIVILGKNFTKETEYPQIIKNKDGTLNYIKDTRIPSFFEVLSGSEYIAEHYSYMEIYNENNEKIAKLKFEKDYSYIKALIPILPEEILYKKIILKEPEGEDNPIESFFIRPEGIMKGSLIMRIINKSPNIVEGDLFTEVDEIIDFEYPANRITSIYTDGRKSISELKVGKMFIKNYNADGSLNEEIILETWLGE